MNGRALFLLLSAALLTLLLAGCGPCMMHKKPCGKDCAMKPGMMQQERMHHMQQAMAPAEAMARKDVLYSCNCGPECKCGSVSAAPGNCACGKPLAWGHVIRVEGDEAILCTCKEGCQCQIDPKDATRCGCGNPVKRVSLKGSGLFFCNCGGSCACNTVATEAGPCKCGMPLKTSK